VLDVDGHVISAEVLVQRVQDLMAVATAGGEPAPGSTSEPALDAPIHAMRVVHRKLHPPALDSGRGLRASVSRFTKRIVRKLTGWYVEPRWALQQELDAQNIEFASLMYNFVYNGTYRIDRELDELRKQNARLKLRLVDANERLSRYQHQLGGYRRELSETNEIVSLQLERLLVELAKEPDRARALAEELAHALRFTGPETSRSHLDNVEFQARFRGSDEELLRSQAHYVSYFPPPSEPGGILDIGCGRGEMLELLRKEGHEVLGVDSDPSMVEVCRSKGLSASEDDGIHFLAGLDKAQLKGIFCAQVVEHMTTHQLEQFTRLALRSLRPGGVLVVETINPRSSFALGNHFYADTTHVRPVHPETLRFMCEQIGFSGVQMEERSPHPSLTLLNELSDDPTGKAVATLLENVFGYQDYVIVATK
jgi:2-polyprenyl-3-methyl-5-hydroxy-6-metoxy-1,4-benzoquinol methylase